jgi:hypothetical protein
VPPRFAFPSRCAFAGSHGALVLSGAVLGFTLPQALVLRTEPDTAGDQEDRDSLVAVWPSVIALKTIARTQQPTIVMNTPFQPQ